MEPIRRILRLARRIFVQLRSSFLIAWYRAQFRNFRPGEGVYLGANVDIRMSCGGEIVLEDGVVIEPNVHLAAERGRLRVGKNSFIGRGCVIVALDDISLGPDALVAAHVTIRDQDHCTALSDTPYRTQQFTCAPISIGANVWLGANVCVLKGAKIGNGCIVGANAVVSGDLPPRSVCVGAPARPIKTLDPASATQNRCR